MLRQMLEKVEIRVPGNACAETVPGRWVFFTAKGLDSSAYIEEARSP